MQTSWLENHPNLKNNRWEPAQNELAIYFNSKDLKGLLTKTLRIPPGNLAMILSGQQLKFLEEGEHTLSTFWERLNSMFQSPHQEILIVRRAALPVTFDCKGLPTLDGKYVDVHLNLSLQVGLSQSNQSQSAGAGKIFNFRNHFMQTTGALNTDKLQQLLATYVRQQVGRFSSRFTLVQLLPPNDAQENLRNWLHESLDPFLTEFGLDFADLGSVQIFHNPTESELAEKELDNETNQAKLNQQRSELSIWQQERELENLRRLKKMNLEETELDIQTKIAQEKILHEYANSQQHKQNNKLEMDWSQEDLLEQRKRAIQLAEIKFQVEKNLLDEELSSNEEIFKLRLENQLEKIRIDSQIEQSKLIQDESLKIAEMQRNTEQLVKIHLRNQALLDAQNEFLVEQEKIKIKVAIASHNRMQAWEEAQNESKIAEEKRKTQSKNTDDAMGLMNYLNDLHDKNLRTEVEIANKKADAELERELKLSKEKHVQNLEIKLSELQHAQMLGALPETALLTMLDNPDQIDALIKLAMIRSHHDMSPDQIATSSNGLGLRSSNSLNSSVPSPGLTAQQIADINSKSIAEVLKSFKEEKEENNNAILDRFERMHTSALDAVLNMGGLISSTAIGVSQSSKPQTVVKAHEVPVQSNSTNAEVFQAKPKDDHNSCALLACTNMDCRTLNTIQSKFCSECGKSLR